MKILLDLGALGAAAYPHQRGTFGILRVVEHITHALITDPEVEACFCAVHNRAASRRYFQERLAPQAAPKRVRFAEPALPGRFLREATTAAEDFLAARYVHPPWKWLHAGRVLRYGVTRLLARGVEPSVTRGLDIYHAPCGGLPPWTRRQAGLRRFMTIYDLAPLKYPEFFMPNAPRLVRRGLASLAPDDWALCISESTRRDLLEHDPSRPPERTLVIPLAAEPFFHPVTDAAALADTRRRLGIPADVPYFLSVSTLEPRKNFETVIRAFAEFVRDDPAHRAHLVLVGNAGWQTLPIFETLGQQDAALRERIITTGYVADADLAALYSGAMAFLYLSFYEGFGLPVLEAMQCGVPVVAANTSSLPEVVGDGGTLLAPTDVEGVCAQMLALHRDGELRRTQSERALARARQFSWQRFESASLAAYRQALAEA